MFLLAVYSVADSVCKHHIICYGDLDEYWTNGTESTKSKTTNVKLWP